MTLTLYGHPFSSYTWKALIPLYHCALPFEFVELDPSQGPDPVVAAAGPLGKFPVLVDGEATLFESTTIIEHLAAHYPEARGLVPPPGDAAIRTRQLDRVFDNYVMNVAQVVVDEHIRDAGNPDAARIAEARARLDRVYAWLERWLADYDRPSGITLVECAAAPALFYADWVRPIGPGCERLAAWRAHLLALPAVSRCVEDARPFRGWFPPGAPDRD